MFMEVKTGRIRPMHPRALLQSSASKSWSGYFIEEHSPLETSLANIHLTSSAVHLVLDSHTDIEWAGGGHSISRRLTPGQISILPANQPYSVKLRSSGGNVMVFLEQKLLSSAAAEQGMFNEVEPVWTHGVEDHLVRELVLGLRVEMQRPDSTHPGYSRSLAATLAARLVRHYATDHSQTAEQPGGLAIPILRATIQFIEEHLAEDLPIERLAAQANLSTAHFARMFKQTTGRPPHQYVLDHRLALARQLLAKKSATLAEVAAQAGFCDQGHLTRCFRQYLGTTPGAYAKNIASLG